MKGILLSFALFFSSLAHAANAEPAPALIASDGTAKMAITLPPDASEATQAHAKTLAEYLLAITGAPFEIVTGDGSEGIALGPQSAFTNLPKTVEFNPEDLERQEDYLIHSHPKGLLLTGTSDTGARNALWDFLHQLGYRQYFPGKAWEIIPSRPKAEIRVSRIERPVYSMRAVWFSGGTYPERNQAHLEWKIRNRADSSFYINAGHVYEHFIHSHREQFEANPDWYPLVDGERKGPKINIANPEVRRAFIEYSLKRLRANPQQISTSADPSDGGGWDQSEEGKAIGSPSNQAIFLANELAQAIDAELPGRYVGLYAYNEHSEPPTIPIRPNVFVLVTTGFRNTLLSLKDQMEGWKKQGATLGIRDYLSYAAANYDIPDRCRGYREKQMARALQDYAKWGARLYSGEASDNWGINGLLYYAMAQLLWNPEETGFLDTFREEFIVNCFGPVADDIRPYYAALDPKNNPVLGPAFLHELYQYIESARAKTPGEAITRRLDDLTLYVRYLELHHLYTAETGPSRKAAMMKMFDHLYRGRLHSTNQARAIIRDLSGRDQSVRFTVEERKMLRGGVPLGGPLEAYAPEEIAKLSAEGLAGNDPLPFKPIGYSNDLIPAAALFTDQSSLPAGHFGHQSGHSLLFYTWADSPGQEWTVTVNLPDQEQRGRSLVAPQVSIWSPQNPLESPIETVRTEVTQGQSGTITVKSPYAGLHWIVVGGARWLPLKLDPTKKWTMTSSNQISPSQGNASASDLYFYVPKGTRVIGAHVPGRGQLFDPDGQRVLNLDKDGYIAVDVPEGQDGKLWSVKAIRGGNFLLLTVPPYLATTPGELLLPREVVEKDLPATQKE